MTHAWRLLIGGAAALTMTHAAQAQPASEQPKGEYVVVAVRAAPGVAHPRREPVAEPVGKTVHLGAKGDWIDGQPCAEGRLRAADNAGPGLSDPLLSDIELARPGDDRRLNRSFVLECGGRPRSAIIPLLQVDQRVLVATTDNGETLAILERPLTAVAALRVERALKAAGLDPGRLDGVLDARARRAIAQFAHAQGAAYTFDRGVLSENLLAVLIGGNR
jgi:hypothetical protein